jgi:hypothetical protein
MKINMMSVKKLAQTVFFLFVMIKSFSQTTLPTEKVDVIKDFEVRLKDSEKKEITPTLPPLDTANRSQNYTISAKSAEIDYPGPSIRPLAVPKDPSPEKYNGLVKAGGSYPVGYLGEGAISRHWDQATLQVGFRQMLLDNTKQNPSQKVGATEALIGGSYFGKKGARVSNNIRYNADRFHYYGYQFLPEYDNSFVYEDDAISQRFRRFSVGSIVENNAKNKLGITYQGGVQFYRLNDNYSAKENNLHAHLNFQKWFAEKHDLSIKTSAILNNYRDTALQKLNILEFSPSFTFRHREFSIKGGASLFQDDKVAHIFPNVELKGILIKGIMMFQAGFKGQIVQENMASITSFNPFVHTRLQTTNATQAEFYGIITGELKKINYHTKVAYLNTSALPLFLTKLDPLPVFDVLLDTVSMVTLEATVGFPVNNRFKVNSAVVSRIFNPKTQSKAWHRPGLEFNTQLTYQSSNGKFSASATAIGIGRIAIADDSFLSPILEINLSSNYKITEHIRVFGLVNNLTNRTNERWAYYRRFGINPMAGLSLVF